MLFNSQLAGHVIKLYRLLPKRIFGTYCAVTSVTAGAPEALELWKGKRGKREEKGGELGECL